MQLRAARELSGKTQAQVAKETGISEAQYQNIEYDKNEPRVRTANRIARAVNRTSEELWGFGAATPKPENSEKIIRQIVREEIGRTVEDTREQ